MVQYRPEVTGGTCTLKAGEVRALFARALQAFLEVSFCNKDTTGWRWWQGDGVRGLESIVKGARKPRKFDSRSCEHWRSFSTTELARDLKNNTNQSSFVPPEAVGE
eukprot:jgi/Botrbrau1/162/Bobra.0022s0146.1